MNKYIRDIHKTDVYPAYPIAQTKGFVLGCEGYTLRNHVWFNQDRMGEGDHAFIKGDQYPIVRLYE